MLYTDVKLAQGKSNFSFFQHVRWPHLVLAIMLLVPLQGMAFGPQSTDPIAPELDEGGEVEQSVEAQFPGIGDDDSLENYVPPKTFTYNFNELNNVQTDVPSLTTELMGDRIDPASGAISWTQTDVSLPGNFALEVAVKAQSVGDHLWFRYHILQLPCWQ